MGLFERSSNSQLYQHPLANRVNSALVSNSIRCADQSFRRKSESSLSENDITRQPDGMVTSRVGNPPGAGRTMEQCCGATIGETQAELINSKSAGWDFLVHSPSLPPSASLRVGYRLFRLRKNSPCVCTPHPYHSQNIAVGSGDQ